MGLLQGETETKSNANSVTVQTIKRNSYALLEYDKWNFPSTSKLVFEANTLT